MRSPGPSFDLRAALSAEVRGALKELDGDATGPKAVHRARVRLKRARALARVGKVGAPGLAEVFNDSARACMHALAPARDATALAEAARKAARKEGKQARGALLGVAEGLNAGGLNQKPIDLDGVRTGLNDLLALAQVWPEHSPRQIARGATRVARRAARARRHAIGENTPELRHTWRKREKDRVYLAEILEESWPRKRKRRISLKLGDALGDERDARLLGERLSLLATPGEPNTARSVRAMKRRTKRLRRRADKLGRRLKDV